MSKCAVSPVVIASDAPMVKRRDSTDCLTILLTSLQIWEAGQYGVKELSVACKCVLMEVLELSVACTDGGSDTV